MHCCQIQRLVQAGFEIFMLLSGQHPLMTVQALAKAWMHPELKWPYEHTKTRIPRSSTQLSQMFLCRVTGTFAWHLQCTEFFPADLIESTIFSSSSERLAIIFTYLDLSGMCQIRFPKPNDDSEMGQWSSTWYCRNRSEIVSEVTGEEVNVVPLIKRTIAFARFAPNAQSI